MNKKSGKILLCAVGFYLLSPMMQTFVGLWTGLCYSLVSGGDADSVSAFLTKWSMGILLVSNLAALGVILFLARRSQKTFGEYISASRPIRLPSVMLFSFMMGIGGCVWGTFVLNMLPLPREMLDSYGESYALLSAGPISVELLATILAAPILEEILFRGLILERLGRIMPMGIANLFQALLFGSLHGSTLWFIYAAVFGCVLGYVRMKTNSIRASILVHIAFNATSYLLSLWLADGDLSQPVFLPVFLLSAVLFIGAAWGINRQRGVYHESDNNSSH